MNDAAGDDALRAFLAARATRETNLAHYLAARNRLVLVHLNLARWYAARFAARSRGRWTADDLLGAAAEGLIVGVEKFDPQRGPLAACLAVWVRHHLQGVGDDAPVSVSARARRKGVHVRGVSLDAPIASDDDRTWHDVLEDPAPNAEDILVRLAGRERLPAALASLRPVEAFIVTRRLLSDEPLPLENLGALLGVSKQRVAQVEAAAVAKLRGAIARGDRI